ncbi:MAG: 30S ribosomal protein S16 [Candidatus Moraniibacteriota bacterium]
MLVIRLNRFGKKNQAAFRLVLQEKTKAPGHRHVEMLGSYNPHSKVTTVAKERVLYWIGQGAQPSDRVHNILVKEKVIEGKIIPKKMPRPVKKEELIVETPKLPAEGEAGAAPAPEAVVTEAPAEKTPEAPVPTETPVETPVEAPKEEVKA